MAKKTSIAKSRVSASHTNINRIIENFTDIHEGNDIKAVPYEGGSKKIKEVYITEESNEKIKISNPPPTHVEVETDEVKRKIKNFMMGKK